MSSSKTTPYLLRNKKQPPVGVARQPQGQIPQNKKVNKDDGTSGKKRKMEEANEDGDQSDIRQDKEGVYEVEEDEDSVNDHYGPAVLDKNCITAEELEHEMEQVLCHAHDICLLWISYTRARGELMELGQSRGELGKSKYPDPKNKAAVQLDLVALRKKYSKRQKNSHPHVSGDQKNWILVLKCLMMVKVQDYNLAFIPHGFGELRNIVVERARELYKKSLGDYYSPTQKFCKVCSKVVDKLNRWKSLSLPPEDMVGYNEWFKFQPRDPIWSEVEYKFKQEEEEEEDQKKEKEGEEEEDQKPAAN